MENQPTIQFTNQLTIRQVAALTQLSVHTLRYYERVGLLDPVSRASSGHRRYAQSDIAWLEFLTRLRATGMPIRQMQQFAELRRQGSKTVHERRQLLEVHQQQVKTQLEELSRNLLVIESKIRHYEAIETN
ncbi:MerR family transcriptional regulator [Leptolyngbya sp. FACHB-261]|uniref:MerR family transcriptional regulator n=1 Tax=Leptolyngbya sp. FACHB-261 TaxID=2692806 RepID=UPI0016836B19|nr:MerR family transcriptional regulator [Leptolyngbya sp. FACHB-261]MBD2103762.1 MerR family transcriptional regulator [Leptolyngbya sp. FACHB-261]